MRVRKVQATPERWGHHKGEARHMDDCVSSHAAPTRQSTVNRLTLDIFESTPRCRADLNCSLRCQLLMMQSLDERRFDQVATACGQAAQRGVQQGMVRGIPPGEGPGSAQQVPSKASRRV